MLVSSGTLVTFRATPAWDFYVYKWSRPECAETGDAKNPGVEKMCVLTVTARLRITATFANADLGGIRYRHIPVHGIGGTLTVSGVESGDMVEEGMLLTFRATPAWKFYVHKWSHPDCSETGDWENPAVEKMCVLTAKARLSVTVTFAEALRKPDPWDACISDFRDPPALTCLNFCGAPPKAYLPTVDGKRILNYQCPDSEVAKHCDQVMRCLFYRGYTEECERATVPLAECHTKGEHVCVHEAYEKTGAVCVPPDRITLITPPAPSPLPPSDVARMGLNVRVHPEEFVTGQFLRPSTFNRAIVSGYEILRETNGSGNFSMVGFEPGGIRGYFIDRSPPSGATVRYKVRVRSDPGPGPVSDASNVVVIPIWDTVEARDCAAENRFPALDLQQCGNCFLEHEEVGGFPVGSDGVCVPREGGFGGLSQEVVCGAFGGVVQEEGDGKICSAIDQAGTFCILDSKDAFPCRGLFKTVRTCNLVHKRPALNPFACAEKCTFSNDIVVGDECRRNPLIPE